AQARLRNHRCGARSLRGPGLRSAVQSRAVDARAICAKEGGMMYEADHACADNLSRSRERSASAASRVRACRADLPLSSKIQALSFAKCGILRPLPWAGEERGSR